MKIIYAADDGKQFENEFDCERYEWLLSHPNLRYIKIYDEKDKLIEDILSDDAYNYAQKVIVPTDLAAKELQDWAIYAGYCYFEQITEAGTWIYEEKERNDGKFIKIGGI